MCKRLVREMRETRSVGQSGASMRSTGCVRSSELANMHYKLISNESVGEIKCVRQRSCSLLIKTSKNVTFILQY